MSTYIVSPTADQEKAVKAFLQALEVSFVKDDENELPEHVLDGIERGRAQIAAGNFLTHEEFKTKIGLVK